MSGLLILGLLAGIVQVFGYVLYIKKAQKHDIDPHPITWLIFAFDTALLTFLEFAAGASLALLFLPVLCSIGACYVALLIYKDGKISWPSDRLDKYILSVGIFIAVSYCSLFVLEQAGFIPASYTLFAAYLFLILSNLNTFVAFVPILKEVRAFPETEHAGPWMVWAGAYFLLLLATFIEVGVRVEGFLLYLYPVSSMFLHGAVGVLALDRKSYLEFLYPKNSAISGTGVYTRVPFVKGQVISKIIGTEKYFRATNQTEALSIETWYGIGEDLWIDPGDSIFRYLNHSCDPNCAVVGTKTLVARRPILQDEELTIDYSMTDADPHWQLTCLCKSTQCRKTISAIQTLPPKVVEEHLPYVPDYFLSIYQTKYPQLKN